MACNSPLAVNTKDRQARTQIARHICIVIKKASKRGRVRRPCYSASYRHELCFVLCFDPVGKKRTEAVAVVVGRRQDGMDGMERRRDAFPFPAVCFLSPPRTRLQFPSEVGETVEVSAPSRRRCRLCFDHAQKGRNTRNNSSFIGRETAVVSTTGNKKWTITTS